jgi:hypothetical protein
MKQRVLEKSIGANQSRRPTEVRVDLRAGNDNVAPKRRRHPLGVATEFQFRKIRLFSSTPGNHDACLVVRSDRRLRLLQPRRNRLGRCTENYLDALCPCPVERGSKRLELVADGFAGRPDGLPHTNHSEAAASMRFKSASMRSESWYST